jgi:tetratricopeptide (TPR) repeat protein
VLVRRGVLLLVPLLALSTACASFRSKTLMYLTQQQWEEELRRRDVDPARVPNPLAVSEPMRETARGLAGPGTELERLTRLQLNLFDDTAFPFRYENRETLTAAEAFFRREGNCLSFTNLFVAMGRALGVPVTTALVKRARASEKEGDLIVVNNHVVAALSMSNNESHYFDFDRRRHEPPTAFQLLDDLWITALYLNNRGADELRAGHPDIAVRFFDDAVRLAPEFAPTWGNVGVARRRLGDIPGAFQAYQRALEIEPDNPTILSNLASLYRALGRHQEADNALVAANLTLASPHVLIVRGDLELTQGHVSAAMKLYKRARDVSPNLADAWVALARGELARKDVDQAQKYLTKALALEPGNPDAKALLSAFSRRPAGEDQAPGR